jgi:transcriptional regulator with XRE-family HTH domain
MDVSTQLLRESAANAKELPFTTGNSLADRILELLGQGLSGSVVAAAVGVTPAYVSQLLEDEDFRLEVSIKRAGKAEAAVDRDNTWDKIEKAAIDKMAQLMPMITRPADLIRIAQIANTAKRTAKELEGTDSGAAPVVQLIVPQAAIIHFKMNAESQVIEIDARSTEALPTQQLQKNLAARRAARLQQLVEVEATGHRMLPDKAEKRKIASTLDAIGYSEEAEEVQNVMVRTP